MDLANAQALKAELVSTFTRRAGTTSGSLAFVDPLVERHPENGFIRSLLDVPMRHLSSIMGMQNSAVVDLAARGVPLEFSERLVVSGRVILAQDGGDLPAPRLGVGYAIGEDGEFELEIRLQNPDIQSLMLAQDLVQQRAQGRARIGILKRFTAHQGAHPAAMNNDPLTLGSSVGHGSGRAGSLGMFVREGDALAFLSCSHVLAIAGNASLGDPIYHPAPSDDPKNRVRIGELSRFENLMEDGAHRVDAAVARVIDGRSCVGNVIPLGHGWESEGRALADPVSRVLRRGTRVAKIGRSSGWTEGVVLQQDYGPAEVFVASAGGNVVMDGLTEIGWNRPKEPFSKPGDSGGLTYLADTLEPLGLVIGGGQVTIDGVTEGRSYVCPLANMPGMWNLRLA